MSVLEFHSYLLQTKLSTSRFNMGNFLLPIIIPASQIALSGNYQGTVFILSSGRKKFLSPCPQLLVRSYYFHSFQTLPHHLNALYNGTFQNDELLQPVHPLERMVIDSVVSA